MDIEFYKAFEDKYRGSRELIKSRLEVYLPFIKPLLQVYPDAQALDLGCGRGEFLELLVENGYQASGVDLDKQMLLQAEKLGLRVSCVNAIDYLQTLQENSQVVISAMHLVEHISFAHLQDLVKTALKVLKPGGILIMETPNPENIMVGCCSFYMDPTHNRPIPPNLLEFLPEYYGYKTSKVLRLQEPAHLKRKLRISLLDVLNGASPDYAVVAQKDADEDILRCLHPAFAKNYGMTIEHLATNYQRAINGEWVKSKLNSLRKVFGKGEKKSSY